MTLSYSAGVTSEIEPVTLGSGTTVIYTPASNKGAFFHQVRIANTSASAVAVTIDKHDGTTAFPLVPGTDVPAKGCLDVNFEFLVSQGWTLRATTATAAVLTVHATFSARP